MSASEASAGLVSFSNKVETNLRDAEKHERRMRRMQRGVIASARLINNDLVERGVKFRAAFGTLTYRPDVAWEPRHVTELLQHYAKWAKRRGFKFRCVWRLEPHGDGRPHYHYVFWMPRGVTPPMPDRQGWWKHGMTNVKWARSPVGYIAKYAAKPASAMLPKGARIWGAVGLTAIEKARIQWCLAPRWLKRMTSSESGVGRAKHTVSEQRVLRRIRNGRGEWKELVQTVAPAVVYHVWKCMRSGFVFQSPFKYDGMDENGVVLSRRDNPLCWSPDGDEFNYQVQL